MSIDSKINFEIEKAIQIKRLNIQKIPNSKMGVWRVGSAFP